MVVGFSSRKYTHELKKSQDRKESLGDEATEEATNDETMATMARLKKTIEWSKLPPTPPFVVDQ